MPSDRIEPPSISDWRDLLTPNERERMDADLAEMARQRRRAEAESRHLEMP